MNTANELKYTRAIQRKLEEWISSPSEEFVRILSADLIGSKRFTPALKDQFTVLAKRAFEQLIGEKINERLKGAMTPDPIPVAKVESVPQIESDPVIVEPQLVTSPEEVEGFYVVRAMLRDIVPPKRITMRDAQSYCAILLDDNNRKPICRLRFNNVQKLRVGIFNDKKEEEIISLESVDDIFNYADRLKATLSSYLQPSDADKA